MASAESANDKESNKALTNGVDGVELGEHYLVMRTDGSWRKLFLLVKIKGSTKAWFFF